MNDEPTPSPASRYQWKALNNLQIGAFTEYFVKMELTMYGLQVYGSEIDDRGIDFVARYEDGPFIQVQVKSLRSLGYVFMEKTKFRPHHRTWLAFGLMLSGEPPRLYLIPSTVWEKPNALFVDRNYEGAKSKPEWGMNVSAKNMAALEEFRFDVSIRQLMSQTSD